MVRTMKTRLLGAVLFSGLLGGVVLPLAAAGTAAAAEGQESPTGDLEQAVSAGVATIADAQASFLDAVDGPEPDGTDGVETEFPQFDPRYVEGPVGGLLNDPFG
jgi:hypothetical protein